MTLIVDTHALIWFFENDSQLSATANALMRDSSNRLLASAASFWEIAIKAGLGKIKLSKTFPDFVDQITADLQLELLPIETYHSARVMTLPHHHRDPFDRMLAAQALTEGVAIVSIDASFDPYGVTRIW